MRNTKPGLGSFLFRKLARELLPQEDEGMSDLICRKTMQRCKTPDMCAPFQGCSVNLEAPTGFPPHVWTDAEKLALKNTCELISLREQLAAKDAEIAELRRELEISRGAVNALKSQNQKDSRRICEQAAEIADALADSLRLAEIDYAAVVSARDEARECVRRLYSAIADALGVLGSGNCQVCQCDGCEHERSEVKPTLRDALAATPEHLRK